jgi:hypothetical protein
MVGDPVCVRRSRGLDSGRDDGGEIDAPTETDAGARSCAELLEDRVIAIDQGGDTTQIHAAALFDGEGVWVVFNRPEDGDTGLFDVFAVRFGCDGEPSIPVFAVQDESAGNDVDPTIAISNDRLLVAWNVDDGSGGTANLQVRYRLFTLDGTPVGDQRQLATSRGGTPVTDNHLGVAVAASDDGFVIAGARAVPEAMRFQAYAQRIDLDGELDGEALEGALEPMVSHGNVAVAAPGADVWLAYEREPDDMSPIVNVLRAGDTPGPALTGFTSSSGPDLAAVDGHVWSAFAAEGATGEVNITLTDVALAIDDREPLRWGELGRLDHGPKIAVGTDGALAVAWYRNISGIRNELWAAPIDASGALGDEVMIYGDPGAAPYQPAITHVMGSFWFVAWSQGTSPDLRLRGRFVELP